MNIYTVYIYTQYLDSSVSVCSPITSPVIFLWDCVSRQDAVIDPWLSAFWERSLELYPLPPGVSVLSEDVL